jgi:hypothetical protein
LASSSGGTFRGCGRRRLGNPPFRPLSDRGERLLEGAPLFRELVLHPDRRLRHHEPADNLFGFELPQPFREHPVADVGDGVAQLRESHPAAKEQLDDRPCPPAADELDRSMELHAELAVKAHTCILSHFNPLDTSNLL